MTLVEFNCHLKMSFVTNYGLMKYLAFSKFKDFINFSSALYFKKTKAHEALSLNNKFNLDS